MIQDKLDVIDAVLENNRVDQEMNADVSIAILVKYGKLPPEALDWVKSRRNKER